MREIDLTPNYREALRLARLRGRAKRHGFKLTRSRWHRPYVSNCGGLVLLDDRNTIVAGNGYSLDLDAAESVLSTMIGRAQEYSDERAGHARHASRSQADRASRIRTPFREAGF